MSAAKNGPRFISPVITRTPEEFEAEWRRALDRVSPPTPESFEQSLRTLEREALGAGDRILREAGIAEAARLEERAARAARHRGNLRAFLVFLAALFLVVAFTGCGSVEGVPQRGLWVEDGIDEGAVMAACSLWSEMGVECVPAVDRETALVVVFDTKEAECATPGGSVWLGQGSVGFDPVVNQVNGWAAMHMQCFREGSPYAEIFVTALAHEIGHALGLDHVTSRQDALMFPYVGLDSVLTPEDRAEFIRAQTALHQAGQ